MVKRVFLSYSRREITFADSLTRQLERQGIDVWVDYRDLVPGGDWNNQLFQAIKSADVLLLVVTPDSIASRNVCKEWSCALSLKKRVVLLIFEVVPQCQFGELENSAPTLEETDELSMFASPNWANSEVLYEQEWIDFRKSFSASLSELVVGLNGGQLQRGEMPETEAKLPPTPRLFLWLTRPLALFGIFLFLWTIFYIFSVAIQFILKGETPHQFALVLVLITIMILLSINLIPLPQKVVRREHSFIRIAGVLSLLTLGSSLFLDQGFLATLVAGSIFFPSLTMLILLIFSPGMYRWANPEKFHYTQRIRTSSNSEVATPKVKFVLEYAPQDAPVAREICSQLRKKGHEPLSNTVNADLAFVLLSRFKSSTDLNTSSLETMPILLQDVEESHIQKELRSLQWVDFRQNVPKRSRVLAQLAGQRDILLENLGAMPLRQQTMPQPIKLAVYFLYTTIFMLISASIISESLSGISSGLILGLLCYSTIIRIRERAITFSNFNIMIFSIIALSFYAETTLKVGFFWCGGVILSMAIVAVHLSRELRLWFPERVKFDITKDIRYLLSIILLKTRQIPAGIFLKSNQLNEEGRLPAKDISFRFAINYLRTLLQI